MHQTLDELTKIYSKTDKGSNGHNYTLVYEKYMHSKKETAKNILEIGAGSGDSLKVWRDYFPHANIYGVDIEDIGIKRERIKVYIGKQEDTSFLGKMCADVGDKFDFIIDDACHGMEQQLISLDFLLPYLNDNGCYFIEDINVKVLEESKKEISRVINDRAEIIEIYKSALNFPHMIIIKKG